MCIQNLTKELENSKAEQIKIQNAMLALKERESCLKQSLESTETKVLFLSERLKACEAEKLVMDSIKAKSSQLHVSIDKLNDKISMLEEEKSTAALRIVELESKLGVSLARLESLRAEKFEADHQAILESQKKDLRIQNLAAQESVYKSQVSSRLADSSLIWTRLKNFPLESR
jgi:chromosome segregation ATPase